MQNFLSHTVSEWRDDSSGQSSMMGRAMTTAWAERPWSCSRFTRHTAGREPRRVG